jgi:hypothetical protein
MKTVGSLLCGLAALLLFYAFFMDTSVAVDYQNGNQFGFPDRVNNLGLMADKQNYMIFGAILFIGGCIIYYSTPNEKDKKKT